MLPKVAKIVFWGVTFGPSEYILPKLIKKEAGMFWMVTDFCSLLGHFSSNLIDSSVCKQNKTKDHDRLIISSPRIQERPLSFLRGHGGDGRLPDKRRS